MATDDELATTDQSTEPRAPGLAPLLRRAWERLVSGESGARAVQVAGALFIANLLAVGYLVLARLNHVQIDLAGHIASADAFRDGLYHQFNDQFFLGYVHGLFYPPIEDAVIAAFGLPFDGDLVTGYKLYLIAVFAVYLAAAWHLGGVFGRPWVRAGFLFCFLFFVNAEKLGIYYQGLGSWDLLVTGLSGQVLAGAFFLWFARALLRWDRSRVAEATLIGLGTLVVLTHMVMGMAAALLLGVFILVRRDWRLLRAGIWITLLTALFWLPFLANRSQLTSATIFSLPMPWPLLGVAILTGLFLILYRRDAAVDRARAVPFLAVSGAIFATLSLGFLVHLHLQTFPAFHYYRLATPAITCLLIAVCVLADSAPEAVARSRAWTRRWVPLAVLALTLIFVFDWMIPRFDSPAFTPTDLDTSQFTARLSGERRHWMLQNPRGSDFGLDSLLAIDDPSYRSAKGLYWESSLTNKLLSSYLATLAGLPAVLDYYFYWGFPCAVQACMVGSFARTYNLGAITLDPEMGRGPIPRSQKACYRQFVERGRIGGLRLLREGGLRHNGVDYQTFLLEPSASLASYLRAVEPVRPEQLILFDPRTSDLQKTHMELVFSSCQSGGRVSDHVLIDGRKALAALPRAETVARPPAQAMISTALSRVRPGVFEIKVDNPDPVLFWIKLNYYDGFRLLDEQGRPLPLVQAYPGMIGYGRGTLRLEYRRPPIIAVGYGISAVTLLAALGGLALSSWRRRRSSSPLVDTAEDPAKSLSS